MYKVLPESTNLLVTLKGISTGSSFLQVVQLKVPKSLTCWVLKWVWLNFLYCPGTWPLSTPHSCWSGPDNLVDWPGDS